MFDPFKDFETSGYLRNKFSEKDLQIVQELEHQMFRASLDEAITHLAKRRGALRYEDFLAVTASSRRRTTVRQGKACARVVRSHLYTGHVSE